MAGICFAEVILGSNLAKSNIQARLIQIDNERTIFPSIEGLPSHLPASEFRQRFGDVLIVLRTVKCWKKSAIELSGLSFILILGAKSPSGDFM